MIPQDHLPILIELALEEDFGTAGDLTSRATVPASQMIQGSIIAKADGGSLSPQFYLEYLLLRG